MFTENQPQVARMWFPCVDNCSSFSTFEMEITTSTDFLVICSGNLTRQEEVDTNGLLKTAYFTENTKITPQSIGLVVGPFKVFADPDLPFVTHFYLSHHSLKNLKHTNLILPKSFQLFEELCGKKYTDFFSSYKQIYIDDPYSETSSFASLSIISSSLLMDERIIDYSIENYLKISKLISDQFFSHYILMKSWSDLWIVQGFSGFLVLQLLSKEFGKNELKMFLMRESKELANIETHKQPLWTEDFIHPSEINSTYLYKKSPLVINMISRIINYSNMKKFLLKLFDSVKDNDSNRFLSTKQFIKSIRKNYTIDLKQFCEYWVYSTGIPILECGFRYDLARNSIEFAIVQKNFEKIFTGNIAIRVQEIDESLEYTIPVDDESSHFEVPCKSKPKKKQRKKPNQEGKDPSEVNKVEVPIKWIRIDPEFEWIRVIKFKQTEQMWVNQLERDKDVVGQYEAIQGLANFPESQNALTKIENLLNDNSAYYQVRTEALYSIAKFSSTEQISPIDTLKKFYKGLFYDRKMTFAKPNDFSNFPLYYIKKEYPLAIASIKDSKIDSMKLGFLIEIYKSNDNSENKFSDCYLIRNLIKAISLTPHEKVKKVNKYIRKALTMDSLIPSPNYLITCACIESLAELQISKKNEFNLQEFWDFFDHRNHFVRLSACKAILRLSSMIQVEFDDILKRFIRKIKEEESPLFKHELLNTIIEYFEENPKNPHLLSIKSPDEEKRSLVVLLWKLIKSDVTEYDLRLRTDLISLYHTLWGSGTPHCYSTKPQLEEPIIEEEVQRVDQRKSIDYSQYRTQYPSAPVQKQDNKKRKNQPVSNGSEEKKKTKKVRQEVSGNVITSASSNKITIKVGEVKKNLEETQIQITEDNKAKLELRDRNKVVQQKQAEDLHKIRSERLLSGKGDTFIILEADNISFPIRLYDTNTSKLLYQSLPLKCHEINNDYKGLTWFPCPGIIKIEPEDNQRQLVEKGEIAFWCSGNSICIGYSQTQYMNIKGINDIFLYEPCNIFAFADDYPKQLTKYQNSSEITIKRPRRCCIEIENIGLRFEIDIYDSPTGDYIWNSLPIRRSAMGVFGDIRYFTFIGKPQFKPTKKTNEITRTFTYYGEVSYWTSGESILLASGGSELNINEKEFKDPVKDQIVLTDSVTVFGRIVNHINKIPTSSMNDSIKMYKRCLRITFGDLEFIADVNDSLSGDIVFRSCPITSQIKLYGECIYFDAELNETNLPQEPSLEKITVDPHDLSLWIDKSNICLAYGKTGSSLKDEPRLTVPCNVFARIRDEYNVVELLKDADLKEGLTVKIEVYDGYDEITIG